MREMRAILRTALLAFLLSRGFLFLMLIAGSQIAFLGKGYSHSVWETRVDLRQERVVPELIRVGMVGDSWFYRTIALDGYDARSAAFFPLYPFLVRIFAISGKFALDAMLLSNIAFAVALPLFGALVVRMGLSIEDAQRSMFYLAFFPTSYFFSLPMTESLFLALSIAAFLAGHHGKWWLAGLCGGLAALTRAPGLLLLLPLTILFFEQREMPRLRIAWLALIPAGTATFMLVLQQTLGDPLAFIHAQRNWGRGASGFWTPIVAFFGSPATWSTPWNPIVLNVAAALLLFAAAAVLLAQKRWSLGAYTLVSVLLPLSSGSTQSLARYAAVVFPLFIAMSIAGRRPSVDRAFLVLSATLLGWMIAFVVMRVDFALA